MTDENGEQIRQDIITLTDNDFQVDFENGDTDELEPGTYYYDVRIVTEPEYDSGGKIIDGNFIGTPGSPLKIQILDTVGAI